jgi:hypothetical protein
MTEILLCVAIVVVVFLLPGMMRKKPNRNLTPTVHKIKISGRMRLAIVSSLLWPALVALFLRPWNSHGDDFLFVALGPVALIWGIGWVWWGFRKGPRR